MAAVLSWRVAIPRHCFRRLMHRSTVLRCFAGRAIKGRQFTAPTAVTQPGGPLVRRDGDHRADTVRVQVVADRPCPWPRRGPGPPPPTPPCGSRSSASAAGTGRARPSWHRPVNVPRWSSVRYVSPPPVTIPCVPCPPTPGVLTVDSWWQPSGWRGRSRSGSFGAVPPRPVRRGVHPTGASRRETGGEEHERTGERGRPGRGPGRAAHAAPGSGQAVGT